MYIDDIEHEIQMIDENVKCALLLLGKCKAKRPDVYDALAAGSLLQTYYNGIENIFKLINKNFDQTEITGRNTHTELFMSMFSETKKRKPVLTEEVKAGLKNYLGFRHVFRHSYGYKIEWERVKPLFEGLELNWRGVKTEIQRFCSRQRTRMTKDAAQ